MMITDW